MIQRALRKANGSPWFLVTYQKATYCFGERRLLFWFSLFLLFCHMLIHVVKILTSVTKFSSIWYRCFPFISSTNWKLFELLLAQNRLNPMHSSLHGFFYNVKTPSDRNLSAKHIRGGKNNTGEEWHSAPTYWQAQKTCYTVKITA